MPRSIAGKLLYYYISLSATEHIPTEKAIRVGWFKVELLLWPMARVYIIIHIKTGPPVFLQTSLKKYTKLFNKLSFQLCNTQLPNSNYLEIRAVQGLHAMFHAVENS